jgi:CheY-like chemotaxis protein
MPGMDGFTATKQIRSHVADALNARIPIVVMTAKAMSEAKELCIKAGMNDYLSKPIDEDELIVALARWLTFSVEEQLIELETKPVDALTEYTARPLVTTIYPA